MRSLQQSDNSGHLLRLKQFAAFILIQVATSLSGCSAESVPDKPTYLPPQVGQNRKALSYGQETTSRYIVQRVDSAYTPIIGSPCTLHDGAPYTDLDEGWSLLSLGFNFYFFDHTTPYTNVYVSANGFIKFGSPPTPGSFVNRDVVDGAAQPNMVAAWWDDLIMADQSRCRFDVTGSAGSRVFTVQWTNVQTYGKTAGHDFQIKLKEGSNEIEILHGSVSGWTLGDTPQGSASIGISDEEEITPATPTEGGDTRLLDCTRTASCSEAVWVTNSGLPEFGSRYVFSRPPFRYIKTQSADTYTHNNGGTPVLPVNGDLDDGVVEIALPSPFVFYGKVYRSVWVSVNGFLSFGSNPGSGWANIDIPNNLAPNNIIAGWWDDMILANRGDLVYWYETPCETCFANKFIFQWNNWRRKDWRQIDLRGTTSHQMRIILNLFDSRIEVQYGTPVGATADIDAATVGLEDSGLTDRSVRTLTCAPYCTEANWPANTTILYSKPTWTHLYDSYFTMFGPKTLHCGACHLTFRDGMGFKNKADHWTALASPITNLQESNYGDPPACPKDPPDAPFFRFYAPTGDYPPLVPRHGDGRADPAASLIQRDYNHSSNSWFNGINMPWDCQSGDDKQNPQGAEELEVWLSDGAPNN